MSGRYGRYIAALGGLIAAVGLLGAASTQQVEQSPETDKEADAPKESGENEPATINIRISPDPDADKNNNAAEEQSGVELGSWPDWVIVAFTAFLAWLSWRQHELEKRLARESGDVMLLAKQNADAAAASAEAARSSAEALALQARITVGNAMPKIGFATMGLVRLEDDKPDGEMILSGPLPEVSAPFMEIGNAGGGSAIVVELSMQCSIVDELPKPPVYDYRISCSHIIAPGKNLLFALPEVRFAPTEHEKKLLSSGAAKPWFWGFVAYRDPLDNLMEVGFVGYWDAANSSGADGRRGYVNTGPGSYTYLRPRDAGAEERLPKLSGSASSMLELKRSQQAKDGDQNS